MASHRRAHGQESKDSESAEGRTGTFSDQAAGGTLSKCTYSKVTKSNTLSVSGCLSCVIEWVSQPWSVTMTWPLSPHICPQSCPAGWFVEICGKICDACGQAPAMFVLVAA